MEENLPKPADGFVIPPGAHPASLPPSPPPPVRRVVRPVLIVRSSFVDILRPALGPLPPGPARHPLRAPAPGGGPRENGVKLLVVEDDPTTGEYLERGLRQHGFVVDLARTREEALRMAVLCPFDVGVFDVMLPDGSGLDLLAELRRRGVGFPVLFLSARGEVTDRLRGFELGADDYIAKPFAFAELVARVRAVARRNPSEPADGVLRVADLELDLARRLARRSGRRIDLTPKQFALLELFMRRPGHVLPRGLILDKVWGFGFESRSNALDVQIKALRDRVDRDFERALIHTVRGVGYVLEDRSAPSQDGSGDGERSGA